ncbi:MAG: tryptophan synthase subunit alpha [Pseudomonadota bacterium]
MSPDRLKARFDELKGAGRTGLIPFVTAGDPTPETTVPLMHALVAAGADVLELGVPFSDPMADGPVIQKAHERALAGGMGVRRVLDQVAEFRRTDATTPVVLMGYLNPVEAMGYAAFAEAAVAAGVDGLLTVDLPPEEAEEVLPVFHERGLAPIFLVSPTTTPERMAVVCRHARGFIYYVAIKGVTGAGDHGPDVGDLSGRLTMVRAETALPVGVGFGIKDPASAAAVGRVADAVIVGSALVRRIEELAADPEAIPDRVAAELGAMRVALDSAGH